MATIDCSAFKGKLKDVIEDSTVDRNIDALHLITCEVTLAPETGIVTLSGVSAAPFPVNLVVSPASDDIFTYQAHIPQHCSDSTGMCYMDQIYSGVTSASAYNTLKKLTEGR